MAKRVRDLKLCEPYWQIEPDNSVTEWRVNLISYWLDAHYRNVFPTKEEAVQVAKDRGFIKEE